MFFKKDKLRKIFEHVVGYLSVNVFVFNIYIYTYIYIHINIYIYILH